MSTIEGLLVALSVLCVGVRKANSDRLTLQSLRVREGKSSLTPICYTLESLNLWETVVGDVGLQYLEALTKLVELELGKTQISDNGLAHLRRFDKLEILSLINTNVSDTGLPYLQGLTALRGLYLEGTQVSDNGLAELQRALPNCSIVK